MITCNIQKPKRLTVELRYPTRAAPEPSPEPSPAGSDCIPLEVASTVVDTINLEDNLRQKYIKETQDDYFITHGDRLIDYQIYGTAYGLGKIDEANVSSVKSLAANSDRTDSGITYSRRYSSGNRPGGVRIEGTATADSYWVVTDDVAEIEDAAGFELAAGTYTNNLGLEPGEKWTGVKLELRLTDSLGNITWCSDKTFTLTETTRIAARLAIRQGYTCMEDQRSYSSLYQYPGEWVYPAIFPASLHPYHFQIFNTSNNLLPNTGACERINGVLFTVDMFGAVTCNGTATADIRYTVNADFSIAKSSLVLKGCPINGSTNSYCLELLKDLVVYRDEGNGVSLPSIVSSGSSVSIVIAAGTVCNDLKFYPMIVTAGQSDAVYQPYFKDTVEMYVDHPLTIRKSLTLQQSGTDLPTHPGMVNFLSGRSVVGYAGGDCPGVEMQITYQY